MKIPRTKDEPGKGGFWRLDPVYAETLVDGVFKKRRPTQRNVNNGTGAAVKKKVAHNFVVLSNPILYLFLYFSLSLSLSFLIKNQARKKEGTPIKSDCSPIKKLSNLQSNLQESGGGKSTT